MRWNGQTIGASDGNALPGMEHLGGFIRSVTTPEFAGMTFHEVVAKSALNHVPGASGMPFDWTVNPYRGCSHACSYCLAPETMILLADGRTRALGDLRVGESIIGTERRGEYRRYVATTVRAKGATVRRAHRVTLADGTELVASADHRFLTERSWKHVTGAMSGPEQRPYLTFNNRLMGFGIGAARVTGHDATDRWWRLGYLAGMIKGDGMILHKTYPRGGRTGAIHAFRLALADTEALERTQALLALEGIPTNVRPFTAATEQRRAMLAIHTARKEAVAAIEALIQRPTDPSEEWLAGYLGGIFDAEGSCSRGVLRISNKNEDVLGTVREALACFDIPAVTEGPRPNGVSAIRVTGGLASRMRFFEISRPAITRKLSIVDGAVKTSSDLRVVGIEDLGHSIDMVDITTGTGDFIANGVISHNCFARGTHEYLELDAGRDFDSQIVVKVNVADVLRTELARPSWTGDPVMLGTNTDPYQRAEGRYRLMPGIIQALTDAGTPFSILTKGTLLRRDLPLLTEASREVDISLAMSIAVFDDALQRALEPGTPSAAARLETVRAATDAGFRVTVFLMPILPHLTDSIATLDDALGRIRAAGAHRVVFGALHLRPGAKQWFWQWLEREHPELVGSYRGLYPGASAYAPKAYRQWLAKRVRPLLRVHGLTGHAEEEAPPREPVPGLAARRAAASVVTTSRGRRADAAAMLF